MSGLGGGIPHWCFMALSQQPTEYIPNHTLSHDRPKVGIRREVYKRACLQLARVAVVLACAWLHPVAVNAEERSFTDDQWASAFSASMPVHHHMGIEDVAIDGQGNVYLGGEFGAVGTVVANNVAKWDGESWLPLSSGIDGVVTDLEIIGNELYAVWGSTSHDGGTRILMWDGQSWTLVGEEFDDRVLTLASSGTDLYAGGLFTSVGGVSANHIARWDGSSWAPVGDGVDGPLQVLEVADGIIYAAEDLGPGSPANIVRWDGSQWSTLGAEVNGWVSAIAVSSEGVFIGGHFSKIGERSVSHIARWHNNAWSDVGGGTEGSIPYYRSVASLLAVGSDLYVGGLFDGAGGVSASRIAKWDGESWYALGAGVDLESWGMAGYSQVVSAMAMSESGQLYATGKFKSIGGVHVANVACWDGISWSPMGINGAGITAARGNGPANAQVEALEVAGNDLYLGGNFAINHEAQYIAKWEGMDRGKPLGKGVNGPVKALASAGNALYAGGWFSMAGDHEATNIAMWDGGSWSPLGTGVDGEVLDIAASGSDIYAGGWFTTAGGVDVNHIAKWDGLSWEPLGSGLSNPQRPFAGSSVHAIVTIGDDLYAAGRFSRAGEEDANNIARWDGNSWAALGSGTDGEVYGLAVLGDGLYAGGYFSTAGGIDAEGIAKWDGDQWSALGSGLASDERVKIESLTLIGNELYVGGDFDRAGGIDANNIARWDGVAWSPLGSGIGGTSFRDGVRALAVRGRELFVGGDFSVAGGKGAGSLALAFLTEVPSVEVDGNHKTVHFRGIPPGAYQMERSTELQTWESLEIRYAGETGGIDFVDETSLGTGFYRAVPVLD